MNKFWITFICLFLILVVISCVVYPKEDLQGTVDGIKSDFSIFFTAFEYVSAVVNQALAFGEAFDKEANTEGLDSLIAQNVEVYNNLSFYIPYHLNKYNLVDRCSNQSWNIFVAENELHTDHNICLLRCYLDSEKNMFGYVNKGEILNIGYCGVCEKIIYIVGMINNSGFKFLYPYDKSGEEVGYINYPLLIANEFMYEEVIDYLT